MKHHEDKEEQLSYDNAYYLVGLFSGLLTGLVLEKGFIWILIMGLFGLLFTAFFISVFVKGRG